MLTFLRTYFLMCVLSVLMTACDGSTAAATTDIEATLTPQVKATWEQIDTDDKWVITHRMKVHGGWLVLTRAGAGVAQTFIPDSIHEWKLQ
jgi:hypothetical protein